MWYWYELSNEKNILVLCYISVELKGTFNIQQMHWAGIVLLFNFTNRICFSWTKDFDLIQWVVVGLSESVCSFHVLACYCLLPHDQPVNRGPLLILIPNAAVIQFSAAANARVPSL